MTPSRKYANRSVRKILDAAEAEFAEKGFDASRVDDVARRAGVDKSHIYYHFASKEALLEELVELRLQELLSEKDDLLAGAAGVDAALVGHILRQSLVDLLARRRDFLRIVLMESLKPGRERPPMARLVRAVTDDALARLRALGLRPDPVEFATVAHFFGLAPLVLQLLTGAAWAAELGLDPAAEQERFLRVFGEIYSAYLDRLRTGHGPPPDGERGEPGERSDP